MNKLKAIKEIDAVISEMETALGIAQDIRKAISDEDAKALESELIKLDDVSCEPRTRESWKYQEELEEFDAEGARADEQVDCEHERAMGL